MKKLMLTTGSLLADLALLMPTLTLAVLHDREMGISAGLGGRQATPIALGQPI